ncbi:MAG: polyisoprenoid-binding protein [Kordiimonadales bacterium]|nr:MAG: polyisoprenoid-binding protein [Kordiimonadales bacterium]
MTTKTLIVCFLLSVFSASALASDWIIDKEASHVSFFAKQTGNKFTGSFSRFTIEVSFDPSHPESGSITAKIDMTSLDAGDKQRNIALPGKEWFDSEIFPTANFVSSSMSKTSDGTYVARGALTLHGVTKPISLPFTFVESEGKARVTAMISLNRGDFGVGSGAWATGKWVSLEVGVEISIVAERAGESQ